MSLINKSKQFFTACVVLAFFSLGLQPAHAGIVTSADMQVAQQSMQQREQLKGWMAKEEVRKQLVDMGVDVDSALARVDAMSNQEVEQLAVAMQDMPVGSGFVETAVLAFLVLVVLEVSGVTDILPNI